MRSCLFLALMACGTSTSSNTGEVACTLPNGAGMLVCDEEHNLSASDFEATAMACMSMDGGVVAKNSGCASHGGGGCRRDYSGGYRILFFLDQTADQVRQICASSQETYVP